MKKLFEAIAYGKQKLQTEWDCLEVYTSDVRFTSSGYTLPWGCSGTEISGTVDDIGKGDANTDLIVAGCATAQIAAKAARLEHGEADDWYLPSKDELEVLWQQKDFIPAFGDGSRAYWSSTEDDADNAYALSVIGSLVSTSKTGTYYVRPIRKVSGRYSVGDTGPGGGVIIYTKVAVPTHKIAIYNKDLEEDDSYQTIMMESPTYSINWNSGVSDAALGGIVESTAEFTIRNMGGVLTDFLEDLRDDPEGTYLVEIQKKTVDTEEWGSFWKGILMPDFSGRADIPNEPISFQATDGMALLDSIEIEAEESELLIVTIIKGLRQIPTVDLFEVLSESRFLWVDTDWYSEDTALDEEPLYQIGLFGKSLWVKKVEKEGYSGRITTEVKAMSYKEVIQHICEKFNAVLMMQQGAWYLFQRPLLKEDTITFETFRSEPVFGDNWRTNPWDYEVETYKEIDQAKRYRADGSFYNLPALKKVKAIYGGGNLADGSDSLLPSGFILEQTYTTMPLKSGSGNYIHLKIAFTERFLIDWVGATPPDVFYSAIPRYKIIVTCGPYYLNCYTGGWTLSSSAADLYYKPQSRLYHNTELQVETDGVPPFVDQISFFREIISEDLPADSAVTFRMERYDIQESYGVGSFTVDIDDNFDFIPNLESHFMMYVVGDESPQSFVTFEAENPTDGFQLEVDLGESLFGTARVIMNRVIGANNGGGELWGVGYSSTKSLYFNELLVKETLRQQTKALLCFSGSIHERNESVMQLRHALQMEIDGTTYRMAFNNVTYVAMLEVWEGDWFEIHQESSPVIPSYEEVPYDISARTPISTPTDSIFPPVFEEIYNLETGDVDASQRNGGFIGEHTTTIRQSGAQTPPVSGQVKMYPDENGVFKQLDSFGIAKIVGEQASKVIPNPDVVIYDGYLYNWYVTQEEALISLTGIADGWDIPTDADLQSFLSYLRTSGYSYDDSTDNKVAKAIATDSGWDVSAVEGAVGNTDYPAKRNVTGLSLRPTGYRGTTFLAEGATAVIWSKTSYPLEQAPVGQVNYNRVDFTIQTYAKQRGHSIRLFRTATAPEQALGDGTVIHEAYIGNDGKKYNGVVLGTQVWLSQNLTETQYNTGGEIPECQDADIWAELTVPARCSYDNDPTKAFLDSGEFVFTDSKKLPASEVSYDGTTVKETLDNFKPFYTNYRKVVDYVAPATDIDSGTATGGSTTTIADTGQSWTVDELAGYVVVIEDASDNDLKYYGLITSNTATVITIDQALDITVASRDAYTVLNTVTISNTDGSTIVALDVRDGNCAVVLPAVSPGYERIVHTIYIEKADNGYYAPILTTGSDNIRGNKWAELFRQSELLTFTLHTYLTSHWDILFQENIRRFASTYWDTDETITNTSFDPVGATANIEVDYQCRFDRVEVSGITWLRYKSLFPMLFRATVDVTVEKSTGVTANVFIAVRRKRDGTDTDFTARQAQARFGNGDIASFRYTSPIELEFGDLICPIAYKTADTCEILAGSHVDILET